VRQAATLLPGSPSAMQLQLLPSKQQRASSCSYPKLRACVTLFPSQDCTALLKSQGWRGINLDSVMEV
jgi:hypothetical protein